MGHPAPHPACSIAAARWFPTPTCWMCQIGLCRFCVHVFPCKIKCKPLADSKTHAVHKEHASPWGVCSQGCRPGDSCRRGCFGTTSFNSEPGLPKFALSLFDPVYTLASIPSLMPDASPVEKQEERQRRDKAMQFLGFVRSEPPRAGYGCQAGTQVRQPKSARCPNAIALSVEQQHRWTARNFLPSLLIGSECLFKIKPDKWHVGGVRSWSTVFRKV